MPDFYEIRQFGRFKYIAALVNESPQSLMDDGFIVKRVQPKSFCHWLRVGVMPECYVDGDENSPYTIEDLRERFEDVKSA